MAHSVESIMLVYRARQCLNNIVGRSVMYADFDDVTMERGRGKFVLI
jgi:hypothetical protein